MQLSMYTKRSAEIKTTDLHLLGHGPRLMEKSVEFVSSSITFWKLVSEEDGTREFVVGLLKFAIQPKNRTLFVTLASQYKVMK